MDRHNEMKIMSKNAFGTSKQMDTANSRVD